MFKMSNNRVPDRLQHRNENDDDAKYGESLLTNVAFAFFASPIISLNYLLKYYVYDHGWWIPVLRWSSLPI